MKNKPSVLIILPWLNYRGAESLALQLCEDLRRDGYRCQLLCLFVASSYTAPVDSSLLVMPSAFWQQLLRRRFLFVVFGFWVMLFCMLRYARQYDVYNPHNFPAVWCAVIAGWVYRRPSVWTVHNFPQHPFRGVVGHIFEFIVNPVDRFFVRGCTEICAVSQKVSLQVFDRYACGAHIIYPGIDVDFFQRMSDAVVVFPFLNEDVVVLQVGQIRPEKNQQYSIDLFCLLALEFPQLRLVFIGEGSREWLSIPGTFSDRISFIGKKSKVELGGWYRRAAVVIYPSAWGEGCTLAPLEAVAAGVHQVAVAAGSGVDEIFKEHGVGIVFDLATPMERVAFRLREYLLTLEREDFRTVLEHYNRATFAAHYKAVFESVVC
jgi:glycosyltransferase involved in cell wall biosynthesis